MAGRLARQCRAAISNDKRAGFIAAVRRIQGNRRKAAQDLQQALRAFVPYADRAGNVSMTRFDAFVADIDSLLGEERTRAELTRQRCLLTGLHEWEAYRIEAVAALAGIAVRLAGITVP